MSFLSIFGVLPGWLWAALLAGALATNCATGNRLEVEKQAHGALKLAVQKQKTESAQKLADETAKTLATERKLIEAVQKQEHNDAKNAALVRDLRTRSVGLRDPYATGCRPSGGSTPAPTSPSANPGQGDQPQAAGLLSANLAQLLWDQAAEADALNIAFASCKQHLLNLDAQWQN